MTGPLVVGLDVSTTAAKAIVVDRKGAVLSEGRATFPLENPVPRGWEQDPRNWLEAAMTSVAAAIAGLSPAMRDAVVSMAIAHQRETFVIADEAGGPLAPAIVWMDGRAAAEVQAVIREVDAAWVHQVSGKVPCTTPSLYKIRMLFERLRPDINRSRATALDVHAYLVRKLTGESITSTASADPLGIVALETRRYDDRLCELAHLRPANLPTLYEPGQVIAPVLPEALARFGLRRELLLVAGAGDGQAAGLGMGVVDEGEAYLNVGTAIVAGVPSKHCRTSRAFRTLISATGDYLLEMDLKGGTLTLDWLADRVLCNGQLGAALEGTTTRFATLARLEQEAATIKAGSEGLIALPYWAGVMNPYWDDDAGGALIGLRADHSAAHIYRAICEGLAFEQRLGLELLEKDAGRVGSITVTGGALQRPFLLQLFASAISRPLARSATKESTALGAALLAFPAAGLARDARAAAVAVTRRAPAIEPGADRDHYTFIFEKAYRGLYHALATTLEALGPASNPTEPQG